MILDTLERFSDYLGVHPLFVRVADFLAGNDLAALPPGRHDIGEEGCFALVSEYETLAPEAGFIECHRRFIDVQIVVNGSERVGICPRSACRIAACDEAADVETLEGEVDTVTLRPGRFAVFLPQDGHMPKLRDGATAKVRKVVIKVPVNPAQPRRVRGASPKGDEAPHGQH